MIAVRSASRTCRVEMPIRSEEKQIAAVLETIQREGYVRLGQEPTIHTKGLISNVSGSLISEMRGRHEKSWIEMIKSALPIFKKEVFKNLGTAITPIQRPIDLSILQGLTGQIEKALVLLEIRMPHPIRFGTAHSGRFNSAMISVKDNRFRLLVVEAGLFTFANLFAKIFVSCLSSTETEAGLTFDMDMEAAAQRITLSSEPFRRFSELMIAHVVLGNSGRAPAYMPTRAVASLTTRIVDGFETFCVAHCYGHCIAGHLAANRDRHRHLLPDIDGQRRPSDTTWAEVFEADKIAAMITIQIMFTRGYDVPLGLMGAFLFFEAVELIERATDVLDTGARVERPDGDPSRGHPPASLRRAQLIASLEERRDGLAEQFTAATRLPGTIAEITGPLWDLMEPAFRDQHDAGHRSYERNYRIRANDGGP